MELVLIRLVDMGSKGRFSDLHCRYTGPTGGAGLIRLVDMGSKEMFSDPHCTYTGPTGGAGFNQIGAHTDTNRSHANRTLKPLN